MTMSNEQRRHIKMLAHGFAASKYQYDHPEAGADEAWHHAALCWRLHLDDVFVFLAICQARDEAKEAARWS